MVRFPVIMCICGVMLMSQASGFWFLKPLFNYRPIFAGPVTTTTLAPEPETTTPPPVQVSAGFVNPNAPVLNQSENFRPLFYPHQYPPQYGVGGQPIIGGVAGGGPIYGQPYPVGAGVGFGGFGKPPPGFNYPASGYYGANVVGGLAAPPGVAPAIPLTGGQVIPTGNVVTNLASLFFGSRGVPVVGGLASPIGK